MACFERWPKGVLAASQTFVSYCQVVGCKYKTHLVALKVALFIFASDLYGTLWHQIIVEVVKGSDRKYTVHLHASGI
jgi:hypothetical protein